MTLYLCNKDSDKLFEIADELKTLTLEEMTRKLENGIEKLHEFKLTKGV